MASANIVWRPGEPVLFDDTYLLGAKNPTAHPRVLLVMDCWNPQLSEPEKHALKLLLETISRYRGAATEFDKP